MAAPGGPSRDCDDVTLTTTDGVRLAADHYRAVGESRGAVALLHGFAGSRRQPEVVGQAKALTDAGFAVLVPDTRGHGDSQGLCTLGDGEQHDAAAAVAWLRARHDRVVVAGASMGAIAALRYSANFDHRDGVIAVSGPSAWRLPLNAKGILSALLTRTRPGRLLTARFLGVRLAPRWSNAESPLELIRRITAPVALVHGRRDRIIAAKAAVELHAAVAAPRRLDIVERMSHAFQPPGFAAVCAAALWALQSD
jgi:uncharacterized protein